ncbi:MAG: hypothetical protein ACUVRA_07610 [Candidatus Bathyarchaeaceae archaeon]
MELKILLKWKKRAFLKGKSKFDEKLFNVVDKVLKQIFGEAATLTIYEYLGEKYSLRREDISSKPEVFAEGLEAYLNSGASVVAKMILDESSELRLGKAGDGGFFEQLRELKRAFYR